MEIFALKYTSLVICMSTCVPAFEQQFVTLPEKEAKSQKKKHLLQTFFFLMTAHF